jgi:hypothetical protein
MCDNFDIDYGYVHEVGVCIAMLGATSYLFNVKMKAQECKRKFGSQGITILSNGYAGISLLMT